MGSYRLLNYSPTGRVWLVTSRLGTGKPITFFTVYHTFAPVLNVTTTLPTFLPLHSSAILQVSSLPFFSLLPAFYLYSIFFKSLLSALCENCDAAWLLMRVWIQLLYSNNRNSLSTFSLFGSVANIGGISPGAVSVACFVLYIPISPISPSPIFVLSSLWWREDRSLHIFSLRSLHHYKDYRRTI